MTTVRNPTKLEAGHNYVVAYCRECPPWRRLAWDRPEAMRAAAAHLQLVHHDARLANNLREQARQLERHAHE